MKNQELILQVLSMLIGDDKLEQSKEKASDSSLYDGMIGEYVICRSRNEGVNAGFLVAADETGVVLSQCRRLWEHAPANTALSWYEGVAESGVSDDSKLSNPVSKKVIIEDYSLTSCTDVAKKSISQAKAHEQN